jgi:archaea-specific DNA-binding protein
VIKKTKPAFTINDVSIGSESLVSSDGRNRDVSTIEISIKRTTQ